MKEIKKVVSALLKEGAERINDCIVKNVRVTKLDNYTRVSLTLNKPVPQYVQTESGDYVKGEHNVVFTSSYSLAALLGESEDTAFAKNTILDSPKLLEMILSYSTIDLVCEPVKAGQEYINPFSNKNDADAKLIEHDNIYCHSIKLTLSKKGFALLSKLEDKMLNEALNSSNTDVIED